MAWLEEIRALALCAVWEALREFDAARGVALGCFVRSRVLSRALAHYRREWAFGRRCVADAEAPAIEPPAADPPPEPGAGDVAEAIAWLPAPHQWLVREIFWRGRTEADIGRELGLSQRGVSKRKQAALRLLRRQLIRAGAAHGAEAPPVRGGKSLFPVLKLSARCNPPMKRVVSPPPTRPAATPSRHTDKTRRL